MKAVTVAAAAVLLGSVSAEGWESWSGSSDDSVADKTTYSKPADKVTTTTWSKPAAKTTTPADDSDDSTWGTWAETDPAGKSTKPAVKTTTTTTTEAAHTWSEWESTSSTPAVETSTDPEHTWSEWSTSSTPAVETSTDPHTWSEWESNTTPAVETAKDPSHTWSAWEPTETLTSTSTQWITVTVYSNEDGHTWSQWSSDPATATTTWAEWTGAVVSSTVTESSSVSAESWTAWSPVATPVAAVDPGCKLEVSVSYGAPIWYPTPVIATANSTAWEEWESTTSADPSTTWSEWAAASSTPAVATDAQTWSEWSSAPAVETSTDPAHTWSEWSSTPAVETSTDPAQTWSAWSSSTPAVETSTGTWSEWSSTTDGGAFYTVPAGDNSKSGNNGGNWSKGNGGISANGNKFGMTYSPYTADGKCKDQGTVTSDIANIAGKGFTSVRVYSTDCSTLEFVGNAARQHGIKVILGVFVSETGLEGAWPQVDAISKWAQWDLVELIVVGNEAVFNGRCTAAQLAGFITNAKKSFKNAGFTGSVSTTDELSIWQAQGQAWCDVVDVVTANLYAFFNPNTRAEDAGDFIQRQIQDLSAVCPGKEVYVMESGWPSAGECNGKACPSPENQATAIKGIQQSSGAKVVFFSFEDEQWKKPGQFGVEQHWGCGEVFN